MLLVFSFFFPFSFFLFFFFFFLNFFLHFISFWPLSGWSRSVPGIKKMPTEVAVSHPGARPIRNPNKKEENKK